jgi:BlaR1 peptidase M56
MNMLAHLPEVSIRSFLLALVAYGALWIVRRNRSAALQHAVWTSVVSAMLALFVFSPFLPRLPIRLLKPQPPVMTVSNPTASSGAAGQAAGRSAPDLSRPRDWSQIAAYVYATVSLLLAAQLAMGVFLVRRLIAGSGVIGSFRESDLIAAPMTVGWLRPQILLPLEWRGWEPSKLNAVLMHEGAHVRRRDGLVAILAALNRCVFWFHPLAWWLERKLALLAEQACDESCVIAIGDPKRYASLLLEMAQVVSDSRGRLRRHALTMAAASHMCQRIESILQEGRVFSRGMSWAGWAAVALCGIPVMLAAGTVALDRRQSSSLQKHRLPLPASSLIVARGSVTPPDAAPAPRDSLATLTTSSMMTGRWTIATDRESADDVTLTIWRGGLKDRPYFPKAPSDGASSAVCPTMCWSYSLPLGRLRGLDRGQLGSTGSMTEFDVPREAGTLHFVGELNHGQGKGAFVLSPGPKLSEEMRLLGNNNLAIDRLVSMAIYANAN